MLFRHYPEEIRYFRILWDKFVKQLLSSNNRSSQWQIDHSSTQAAVFAFARRKKLNLVTPFAVLTVGTVLQEMNLETGLPTFNQIKNAIRKCATEFGASPKVIGQMEHHIAGLLYSMFKQVAKPVLRQEEAPIQESKQIISVSLLKPTTIDGMPVEIQPRQAFLLFCEFVRKQRLHWAHGFSLFERWSRFPPPHPERRFRNIIDKLNMSLKNCEALVKVKREKEAGLNTGFSSLMVPRNVEFAGDITQSRSLYENAQFCLKSQEIEKSIEMLQESFKKDPNFLDLDFLLANVIHSNPKAPFDGGIVRRLWYKLCQEEVKIQDAILVLNREGKKAQWKQNWASVVALKSEFEQNLSKISESKIVSGTWLQDKEALSQEELEFKKVSGLINTIRNARDYSGLICSLLEFNIVKDVFKKVRGKLIQIFQRFGTSQPDWLESIMLQVFTEDICRRGKRPEHYGSHPRLKDSWVFELSRKTADDILMEIYSIDKTKQRLMREYEGKLKKIRQLSSELSESEILSKLGPKWDAGRLKEAKEIHEQMALLGESVDIEKYWNLFKKRPTRKY